MATPKTGDIVVIDFSVTTADGRVVGGTDQNGPQTVTMGKGEIMPSIEAALEGMEVGAQQDVTIDADQAFGQRRDDLIIEIPRSTLPPEPAPQPGMTLAAKQQDGSEMNLTITAVGDETVTADGNHPLAGEDLTFGLTLVEIRAAA
ncbi:peptidylprolyl isomerase [Croceicoccus sp. Ery5]|jgi:FKBP-type peptidyl-prolyl cis-trans isomerase 2|uniref:FKBP-type peptidyl-prolyl cis-trans isomerase n=1 Tax=Croceicoccus sp. Ery5 TaxID=1703340 RepID=UPI001E59BC7C|nr:FKBP-type peptidyl-prolyl cis-trans isomerase [Croceicoccus sp. Ery5]